MRQANRSNPSWLPRDNNPSQHWGTVSLYLCYASALTFMAGIVAPSFTMIPSFGGGIIDDVAKLFMSDEVSPKTMSLVGGILHLFDVGDHFIGLLLLLFSIVFPALKLGMILYLLHQESHVAAPKIKLLELSGKWSLLDVFVVSTLVILFKGFPGGSRVKLEWGLYFFAFSVVAAMLATMALKKFQSSKPISNS